MSKSLIPKNRNKRLFDFWLFNAYILNVFKVMFSDTFPGTPFTVGNNITLEVVLDNIDELNSYFARLKDGGKVGMDLQETFWSKCYGSLTDKFGIGWKFSHESEETGM
jgi:PhnB protein